MKIYFTAICFLIFNFLNAQNDLRVKEFPGNNKMPLVLYLSGDGGLNKFTNALCQGINAKGYEVSCIDSRSYFWKKKTPQQTTNDVVSYITTKFKTRVNQEFVLAGFSFGADIVPFVANRLPDVIRGKLKSCIAVDIGTSTSFEIRLVEMLGASSKAGFEVLPEVNKMGNTKFSTIQSADAKDFPLKAVRLKNYKNTAVPGNHHFDDNIGNLAVLMINCF